MIITKCYIFQPYLYCICRTITIFAVYVAHHDARLLHPESVFGTVQLMHITMYKNNPDNPAIIPSMLPDV